MVAARQSSNRVEFSEKLIGLSISYDGKPKVGFTNHQEEIDAAYQKGYNEASSQYNQQIVDFRTEVNALREGTFSALEEKFGTILREAREALSALTYDCVCRTLGGYEMNSDVVEKIVNSVIDQSGLRDEQMEVHLNPADIALLADLDGSLEAQHPGLQFVSDESLVRGDCILTSRFGKVDGLMSTKLAGLKESLNPDG